MGILKKFKELFFKPDVDDHYIIEKWKKETDEADRIKRANQSKRNKNKTLSTNF